MRGVTVMAHVNWARLMMTLLVLSTMACSKKEQSGGDSPKVAPDPQPAAAGLTPGGATTSETPSENSKPEPPATETTSPVRQTPELRDAARREAMAELLKIRAPKNP